MICKCSIFDAQKGLPIVAGFFLRIIQTKAAFYGAAFVCFNLNIFGTTAILMENNNTGL